eukprot:GHVU01078284.1.p1 GENE.GHVU01078284.1~~GHVU01078284.1.p1  ORF type:complete len:111 (-),score=5.51 GHVU01078284.1:603-935(-)
MYTLPTSRQRVARRGQHAWGRDKEGQSITISIYAEKRVQALLLLFPKVYLSSIPTLLGHHNLAFRISNDDLVAIEFHFRRRGNELRDGRLLNRTNADQTDTRVQGRTSID